MNARIDLAMAYHMGYDDALAKRMPDAGKAQILASGDLAAENAKLREVANLISEYISYDRCEGCVVKTACNSHELDVCWMVTELRNQLRELGVEVDA